MRLSTPTVLLGCLFVLGLGCAKSDGGGDGQGGDGSSATGGSSGTGTGGSGSGTGGNTGAGGSTSTGGSTGNGGSVATGGKAGTGGAKGGSTGTGGSPSTGGSTGTGGATGTGGSSSASCTITPTAMVSTKIGTVGIVTFTTTLSSPTAAQIDFGPDTNYGLTAPVDITQAASNYKTLLLGMKPSKAYHYRISVTNASGTCAGGDNTIMTNALPNGLPKQTITTSNASGLYGGFLVTGQYAAGGTAPAFIFDKDGAYVWAYTTSNSDACGTAMSYDGQYMWIVSANVPDASNTDHVHRVSMDGMTDTDFTTAFAHHSHQITPLPDGSVAFYASGSNGCDDIKILPANATASTAATTIANAKTAHGGTGSCHVNNIEYSPSDDTLIFSDLDNNCLTKVTKTGTAVWVLNGGVNGVTDSFNSGALIWKGGEHGFHILPGDGSDLVIFNNNSKNPAGGGNWGSAAGDGSGALVIEVKLNVSAKTASQTWMYKANPALVNDVLGDVQRLSNGNTMISYATKGTLQEIDANGTLLQQITTQTNFGYIQKRTTLYGPPPR